MGTKRKKKKRSRMKPSPARPAALWAAIQIQKSAHLSSRPPAEKVRRALLHSPSMESVVESKPSKWRGRATISGC